MRIFVTIIHNINTKEKNYNIITIIGYEIKEIIYKNAQNFNGIIVALAEIVKK